MAWAARQRSRNKSLGVQPSARILALAHRLMRLTRRNKAHTRDAALTLLRFSDLFSVGSARQVWSIRETDRASLQGSRKSPALRSSDGSQYKCGRDRLVWPAKGSCRIQLLPCGSLVEVLEYSLSRFVGSYGRRLAWPRTSLCTSE